MTKRKPFSFVYRWPLYPDKTLVCVGYTAAAIVAAVRRVEPKNGVTCHRAEEGRETFQKSIDRAGAFFARARGIELSVLWFETWKDDWPHWDTLNHEVRHMVDLVLVEGRGMGGELEGLAYAHAGIFRDIRRALASRRFP